MKRPKRIPAILLTLVLALGLATPALAAEGSKPTYEEAKSYIKLESSKSDFYDENIKFDLYSTHFAYGNTYERTLNIINKVNSGVKFRLTNTAPAGSGISLFVTLRSFEWCETLKVNTPETFVDEEGFMDWTDHWSEVSNVYLENWIEGGNDYWRYRLDAATGSWVAWDEDFSELGPGESCTFDLGMRDDPVPPEGWIYSIGIYPQYNGEGYDTYTYFPYLIDNSVPVGELEGVETPKELTFNVKESRELDNGVGYNYTITNNTDQQMTGYYALLSYLPRKGLYDNGTEHPFAQLHAFDIDLAPGESTGAELSSYFYNLSGAKLVWITFDSKAERDSFFTSPALSDWGSYYEVTSEQWLKDNFNITLLPAK